MSADSEAIPYEVVAARRLPVAVGRLTFRGLDLHRFLGLGLDVFQQVADDIQASPLLVV